LGASGHLRGRTGLSAPTKNPGQPKWSLGLCPKLRKPKTRQGFWFRFNPLRCSKMAFMPFLSCKFFALQKNL
jgi:hypothetical protein